jgi:hypothetical protein
MTLYPDWLRQCESEVIDARRAAADIPLSSPSSGPVGLALSGGGIRSATFCLGVLQALARTDLLRMVDVVSTVSGGSYIGAFLGGLYTGPRIGSPQPSGARTEQVRQHLTVAPDSFPVSWLRRSGRYLAPSGAASWLAGAVLLRNWLAVLFVLAVGTMSLALVIDGLHLGVNELRYGLQSVSKDGVPEHALLKFWRVVGSDSSPLFLIPIGVVLCCMLPPGIAYWMIPTQRPRPSRWSAAILLLASAVAITWAVSGPGFNRITGLIAFAIGLATLLSVFYWLRVSGWERDREGTARNTLSQELKTALVVTLVFAGIALCDALGQGMYRLLLGSTRRPVFLRTLGSLYGVAAAVAVAGRRILATLGPTKLIRTQSLVPLALLLGAFTIVLGTGALISLGSHAVIWQGQPPYQREPVQVIQLVKVLTVSLAATFALSRFYGFVNRSSLASLYSARLTRAYLGASNDRREKAPQDGDDPHALGPDPIAGDQITLDQYRPHAFGGPLHLINVTINETIDPRVQMKQPDRHGLPLIIGPCAVSVGAHHHAKRVEATGSGRPPLVLTNPEEPGTAFSVFPPGAEIEPEQLTLGDWVAISGAAVAPGLGSRTRLGSSLLLGFFNMRLGHWWDSGVDPRRRKGTVPESRGNMILAKLASVLPIYAFLLSEMLARFRGTAARHWYLTDGGHFENTGCYELVRRRLPFIVCCDAGEDPDYVFEDVANLVRLARIDFGAEITFLTQEELVHAVDATALPYFGTLEELGTLAWKSTPVVGAPRAAHAALARIRYGVGVRDGLLLVIKPTICGDEPQDVRAYAAGHEAYPQESTADQFFDDAQWEAYRRLGDHIGTCLFQKPSTADDRQCRWQPCQLRPFDLPS